MDQLNELIRGAVFMGFAVLGLLFLKFWRRTHDPLLFTFAIAMWILAGVRLILSIMSETHELRTFLYLGRVLAYVLILWAIFRKNRASGRNASPCPGAVG